MMTQDSGLPNETVCGGTPDEIPLTEQQLVRLWWHVYLHAFQSQAWTRLGGLDHLNQLTQECEQRGIVVRYCPMPREGAEDLAEQVDAWKKKHGIK